MPRVSRKNLGEEPIQLRGHRLRQGHDNNIIRAGSLLNKSPGVAVKTMQPRIVEIFRQKTPAICDGQGCQLHTVQSAKS